MIGELEIDVSSMAFCLPQATAVLVFMWYWVFYHCLTEPEHLYGHWHPPDPRKFTDAELGIPGVQVS